MLYNADGDQQLLATNNVLGSIQPFSGNYGISKNPESFAAESFRSYFTDKQRGAVIRLSMDGLTPISDAGMHDFFRDNLRDGESLYGSYDAYKKDYNLTINYGDNTGKTISFSEKSKGWTSLKSFIPEVAISSVNQYYTMNFGQLWKHHQEFELDGTTVVDRNTFYGVFEDSSVTPVLNTQPEVVKNFNTLNYEGSQSRVDQFLTYEVTSDQPFPIGANLAFPLDLFGNPAPNVQLSLLLQAPNSNVSFTSTTNNVSIIDFHGESGQSDIAQITVPDLDITKTYRLSFNFNVTGQSGQSHVYFGGTSFAPVTSTSLTGGVFSEDFIPTNTTELISILHPHLFNGFTMDVNVELTNVLFQELDFTTDENDGEYYNLQAKKGWHVEDIHTDKQEGTLNEFVEKEGKWFNYIKGKTLQVDTAAFNFQGLGIVETIQ